MSHLVNLSDEVYEELTKMKNLKKASYSEIIKEFLEKKEIDKTEDKADLLAYLDQLKKKYKSKKKEKISKNVDEILYG